MSVREEDTRHPRRTLELLAEFEKTIGHLQVHRIIGLALDFMAEKLDVDRVSIALLEEDRRGFRLLDVRHDAKEIGAGVYFPFDKTVLSRVVEELTPLYREDILNEGPLFPTDERFTATGLKSDFLIPLIAEDYCIGTLNAASTRIDGITEDSRDVLTLLAPRLAHSLWNAQLFEALEEAHGKLEHLVEERTAELARTNEQLRQEIDERKRAEQQLQKAHDELEHRVAERTAEIEKLKDRLQAENVFLREELEGIHAHGDIVGESTSLKTVIRQIQLVAPTDASVLILGESGTGKELVAREIHRNSGRRDRSLIKVNCATIPRELYESEFFGHVKGSFTGATRDREGRFEAADGGTLFLDEVGEIPLELQSKLLRVLQEGEYERVGDTRTRKVDVRIIAATNKDLKREVEEKRFREDLFYRLNVFPVEISPLRRRKEDIPLLANHFLDHISRRLNRPRPRLTQANLIDLQSYEWPGNVRELQNVIERAVILSRSKTLFFEFPRQDEGTTAVSAPAPVSDQEILTEEEMKKFERANLLAAFHTCNWKIYGPGGAAELLGLKPTTLIARMKKMGLKKPR